MNALIFIVVAGVLVILLSAMRSIISQLVRHQRSGQQSLLQPDSATFIEWDNGNSATWGQARKLGADMDTIGRTPQHQQKFRRAMPDGMRAVQQLLDAQRATTN